MFKVSVTNTQKKFADMFFETREKANEYVSRHKSRKTWGSGIPVITDVTEETNQRKQRREQAKKAKDDRLAQLKVAHDQWSRLSDGQRSGAMQKAVQQVLIDHGMLEETD